MGGYLSLVLELGGADLVELFSKRQVASFLGISSVRSHDS